MYTTIRPTYFYALTKPLLPVLILLPFYGLLSGVMRVAEIQVPSIASYVLLAWYVYKVLLIRSNVYSFSSEVLKYTRGVFSISEDYIELYRIKDFRKTKPFLLRLIGCMNVDLISSDRSMPVMALKGIPSSGIIDNLRYDVELRRDKKRVFEVD